MINEIDYYAMKIEAREDMLRRTARLTGAEININLRSLDGVIGNYKGSGAFAQVFALAGKEDVVVKIFDIKSQDCYGDYLKWCLDNQECKFVPKIYKVLQFGKEKVVFMEKLYHEENNIIEDLRSTIGQTQSGSGGGDMNFERLRKHGVEFMDFMKNLCNVFKDYNFDMHGCNTMFREDGTPVVTDPITTKRKTELNLGYVSMQINEYIKRWQELKVLSSPKSETIPKFEFGGFKIPKYNVVKAKPFWQKDNIWA